MRGYLKYYPLYNVQCNLLTLWLLPIPLSNRVAYSLDSSHHSTLLSVFTTPPQSEKPLGVIPLADLTVLELDNSECELPVGRRKTSRSRTNRILLITMTGMRVVLEATTGDERNLWVTDLKVAVASQQISSP